MSLQAIVFDFDGVLVESVDVKTQAFATLYKPWGEKVVAQVVAWHLEHGGVSRFEKFRHFHRYILCKELDEAEEERLGRMFSQLVEDAVVAADWVDGAEDFLKSYAGKLPLFVASGTPEVELRRIISRRRMEGFFRGIFGSPARKGEILRRIAEYHGYEPQNMLMVGDAVTDLEGAREAGVSFIGRVGSKQTNPFPQEVKVISSLHHLNAHCG